VDVDYVYVQWHVQSCAFCTVVHALMIEGGIQKGVQALQAASCAGTAVNKTYKFKVGCW
jgi:hypothetical protein